MFLWKRECVPYVVTKDGDDKKELQRDVGAVDRQWGQREIPRRPDWSQQLWEKLVKRREGGK